MNSKLYETIAAVQPKIPGWCIPEKAFTLAGMVMALRPQVSLEIGVFAGSSFIPIALAHQALNLGMAIGVDAWDANVSIQNEAPEHVAWWGHQNHEAVYREFLELVKRLGLTPRVAIHRLHSDLFESPAQIGLLHVDGSHTEQAVRDVKHFAPCVQLGGFCVMDDLDWVGGGPVRGAKLLEGYGFRQLYPLGTGAVYQRLRR